MDAQPGRIVVDVVSDVVCPWCFVGKRRLEAALASDGGDEIAVRWRPFQLDPTIPKQGLDRRAYMSAKFRDESRIAEAHARLESIGAELGIAFNFENIQRSPNTLNAHRLIRWAEPMGMQDKIVERLFRDYFERGRDIGDIEVLVEAARDCGLDTDATRAGFASDDDLSAVTDEIENAQKMGVSGVPFFIFASRYAVSGAQESAVLAQAISKAREDSSPVAIA